MGADALWVWAVAAGTILAVLWGTWDDRRP